MGDKEYRYNKPRTYGMGFPAKAGLSTCPVEECSGRVLMRTEMQGHFWHRHVRVTVVILEEGNLPQPRWPLCDMLMPWRSLNGMHRCKEQCKRVVERKRRSLAAKEGREVTSRAFSAYGRPLEMVASLRYLGQVILAADDEWLAVVRNLSRERVV